MKPPISEPFVTPPAAPDAQSFRVDFFRSLVGHFCVISLIGLPLISSALNPNSFNSHLFVLGVLIFTALFCAAISLFYPVEIGVETSQGFNFWATTRRKLAWPEITRVRFAWFVFPYALISTAKHRDFIWLPLHLSDRHGFARAVEELAPAGNPLRLFLEKRGF